MRRCLCHLSCHLAISARLPLQDYQDILERRGLDCRGWALVLCGHSLGAGIAALLAPHFRDWWPGALSAPACMVVVVVCVFVGVGWGGVGGAREGGGGRRGEQGLRCHKQCSRMLHMQREARLLCVTGHRTAQTPSQCEHPWCVQMCMPGPFALQAAWSHPTWLLPSTRW